MSAQRYNFHTHTNHVDGHDAPEAMVLEAIARQFTALGFSEHAYQPLGTWEGSGKDCLSEEETLAFPALIDALRVKFEGVIDIFKGLEIDCLYPFDTSALDYFIGSLHMIKTRAGMFCVDHTPAILNDCLERAYDGDGIAMARDYYEQYASIICAIKPDIAGHIDLITKFDETGRIFKTDDRRYIDAALTAVDAVIGTGAVIELNTGAVSRGYRTTPYPASFILKHIRERGGRVMINSDAHDRHYIDFGFDECRRLLKSLGFTCVMRLTRGGFVPDAL